jgi:hypothetical protein
MIRVRHLRFWTALLIGTLCAYPLLRAIPLVTFGVGELLVDADTAAARLGGYVGSPSVGFLARPKLLALVEPEDSAQRAEDLTDLLSLTPISGANWLQLSVARYALGASPEKIASALALSNLTAPNEADVMAGRAVFGLPLWAALPPDSRRTLIVDLVGGWDSVDESGRAGLKAGLGIAPEKTRQEIRAALLLWGKAGAPIETALGLTPPPFAKDEALAPTSAKSAPANTPPGILAPATLAPPTPLAPAIDSFRGTSAR